MRTIHKALSVVAITTIIFVAAMVPTTASAAPPPVPDRVASWFKNDAPSVMVAISATSPTEPIPSDHLVFPFGSQLGQPVTVMIWGDRFLQAKHPSDAMLVARGDWIAPVVANGKAVGTFNADIMADGTIGYGFDDNAEAGAAILGLQPHQMLASDSANGYFVIDGDTARQAGLSQVGIKGATGSLIQLQAALTAWKAGIDQQVADNSGQPIGGITPLDFGSYLADNPASTGSGTWLIGVGVAGAVVVVAALGLVRRGRWGPAA